MEKCRCGGSPGMMEGISRVFFYAYCNRCDEETDSFESKFEAIKQWNLMNKKEQPNDRT